MPPAADPTETLVAFVSAGGELNAGEHEAFMRGTLALKLDGEVRVPDRVVLFDAMAAMIMNDPEAEHLRLVGEGDQLEAERERLIAQGVPEDQLVPIERLSAWVPVTAEQLADGIGLRWSLEASFDDRPLTLLERLTGRRTFTSSDGVTGSYAVSWRARLEAWRHRNDETPIETCPSCGRELGPEHDPIDDEAWGV